MKKLSLGDVVKAVLRGKLIVLNVYIRKKENQWLLHPPWETGKRRTDWTKHKRRNERIKSRNKKIENLNNREKSMKPKAGCFWRSIKIDQPLTRLIITKRGYKGPISEMAERTLLRIPQTFEEWWEYYA